MGFHKMKFGKLYLEINNFFSTDISYFSFLIMCHKSLIFIGVSMEKILWRNPIYIFFDALKSIVSDIFVIIDIPRRAMSNK